MRFTRDWGGNRSPIHCCLFDRECWHDYRAYYMPMRLHLHFLKHEDGFPVFFTLWGGKRSSRYIDQMLEAVPVDPRTSAWSIKADGEAEALQPAATDSKETPRLESDQ
jgi:hypothetical protein